MKKCVVIISLLVFCLIPVTSVFAEQWQPPTVFADGKKLVFKVQPAIINGSALVPLRSIFEALGAKLKWDGPTQTITATKNDTIITYTIGNLTGRKNNEIITIPVPGQLINGTTLIPIRFVSEALGATVSWDENSRTILVSSKLKTEVTVTNISPGNIIEIKDNNSTDKIALLGFESLDPDQAAEATEWIANMLANATILVEVDVKERNSQGNLLAYVYLPDGTMLNAALMAKGFAKVSMESPNIRWNEFLNYVQAGAKNEHIGLWSTKVSK